MITNRKRVFFYLLTTICLLLLAVQPTVAQSGPTTDPLPIISLGTERAMVVRLDFLVGDVLTTSVEVVPVPPPAFVGAPPQLLLTVYDANGTVLQSFYHWDPRHVGVHDGTAHHHEEVESASGRFVIPFTIMASTLQVVDLENGNIELIVVDLEPAIQLFCEENPTVPECIFDVSITKAGPVEAVAAGTTFDYTIEVENLGINPALGIIVVDTLPAGVTFVSSDVECVDDPPGTVTCAMDSIPGSSIAAFTMTVAVAPDLVYNNGGPLSVENDVTAETTAGTDTDLSNNDAFDLTDIIAVADLQIIDMAFANVPADIVAGEPVQITVNTTITNGGPSGPMDVTVNATATASAGATVTPTNLVLNEIALGLGELRPLSDVYTLECSAGLPKTFSFAYSISPTNIEDTDPNLLNNDAANTLELDCVIPVEIDVRPPGNEQNPVNLGSNGVLRVGIMSNPDYDLHATDIDPATISLEGATVRQRGNGDWMMQERHLNDDGWTDIIVFVETNEIELDSSATEAELNAKTFDGISVRGSDNIRIVGG